MKLAPITARPARFALLAALLLLGGCETMQKTIGTIAPWSGFDADLKDKVDLNELPVEQLYNGGVDAMAAQRYQRAAQLFESVETNYPYSSWATNAQLMGAYASYLQNRYTDSISILSRFIQLHPTHKDVSYAYYLRALNYYEQISDIEREQKSTELAVAALQDVVNRFPESSYAIDARLKIDLCRDHLAGKEMEVGRYYEKQHLYTAALGRFQRVVDDFQTTNHVPEALHRLTEIYLRLGMTTEARRTAAVLGHNYPGNEWYEESWNTLVAQELVKGEAVGAKSEPGILTRTVRSIGNIF